MKRPYRRCLELVPGERIFACPHCGCVVPSVLGRAIRKLLETIKPYARFTARCKVCGEKGTFEVFG